jgi:hypothetical protein
MQFLLKNSILLILLSLACQTPKNGQKTAKNTIRFIEKKEEKKVEVWMNGTHFTNYIYPENIAKPVLYPLITASGQYLTRGYPLDPQPGERSDHPHHIGYWFNYGDVNGFDFWNNSFQARKNRRYGYILHQSIKKMDEANGILVITAKWFGDNEEALLEEETTFKFSSDGKTRQIDRETRLIALKDCHFSDNKEGMVAIRVIRALELPSQKASYFLDEQAKASKEKVVNNEGVHGDYLSSEGQTGSSVWGSRAKWMHLHGHLESSPISLTLIDHPDNIGYPTYWHARGYGLFSANPLGQKVFSKGKEILDFKLKKGANTSFKYRLLVHGGTELSTKKIQQFSDDFEKK